MSAITIMASRLDKELRARGVCLSRDDCAEILRAVIDHTAELAAKAIPASEAASGHQPPKDPA